MSKNSFSRVDYFLIISFFLILSVIIYSQVGNRKLTDVLSVSSTNTTNSVPTSNNNASQSENCGQLDVKVSTDGKDVNAKQEIYIDKSYGKYYLHVKSKISGLPCAISFDARLPSGKILAPWQWKSSNLTYGAITSNADGIARLDLGAKWPLGVNIASFRQNGTTNAWSNTIRVNIVDTEVQSSNLNGISIATPSENLIDGKKFHVSRPGNIYIYKSQLRKPFPNESSTYNSPFRTMMQVEEQSKIGNLVTVPWRYTKENKEVYWNPGGTAAMRWFVAQPGTSPTNSPSYRNWIWAIGTETFNFAQPPALPLREFIKGNQTGSYLFKSTTSDAPAYSLMPMNFSTPYFFHFDKGYVRSFGIDELKDPQLLTTCSGRTDPCPNHIWDLRIDQDNVVINGSQYKYQGPALRVDYYEITMKKNSQGLNDPSQLPYVLRESWYFVENVGVVLVEAKTFNNYPTAACREVYASRNVFDYNQMDCSRYSPSALLDSDATADRMTRPASRMMLDEYYNNPTLRASVALVGETNYRESVIVNKQQDAGYQVKFSPPVTGWIEARVQNSDGTFKTPIKWLWSEKGIATANISTLMAFPPSTTRAQFRVWVPNDSYLYETRVGDTNIPWSNTLSVTIR